MKKHSLLKVLAILLFLVVVVSYFVEGRSGISRVALGDVAMNYIQSFYYFFDTVVFALFVGAFYELLEHVPGYNKLKENVVSKVEEHKNVFVLVTIAVFAIISSLTGLYIALLIFIPFFASVIMMLGYDKIVALLSTLGATIIGLIGGIFTTFRNPSGYTASSTTIEKLVGLEGNFENIFPKIIILILATALLMFYVLRYSKNHMTNKIVKKVEHNEEDKKDEVKEEKKEEIKTVKKEETKTTKKVPTKNSKKKTSKNPNMRAAKKDDTIIVKKGVRTWPLVVVCALMLVLLILGFIPWQSLFEITVFDDFHTWLTGISIGDYSIFNNIMSANFTAFGTWGNLGSYMMPMILIIIFSIIIAIIYRIKLSDMLDYFKEGAKKMLPSAMMAMLAYTVLVCTYNNGFMETIISKANVDNIMLSSLLTILGSITNVDLYYTAAGIFTPIVGALSDNANLNVFALVFQSFYGLIQLFGPTSILLIFGLTYFEVPYKDWLKNIWRLILGLFIIIFLVVLIVALV